MTDNIRVLLADDHAVMRTSLGMLLQAHGIEVAGEAASGESAIEQALALRPDVVLMDITLQGMDGIEATRRLCAAWPEAKVLALTMHGEDAFLAPFLEAGGLGYVNKSAADRQVLEAIQAVAEGETYVGEQGLEALLRAHRPGRKRPAAPGPETLSERELLVLKMTARGFTSREIGEQLGISPHTVDTYRSRLMEKLGLEHRHQLVDYALQHRILSE